MDQLQILAKVNGQPITSADLDAFIISMGPGGERYNNPEGRKMVLEQLINKKLFLADKPRDWKSVGAAFARLYFTSENSRECVQVFDAYAGDEPFVPHEYTRGLYYRGVE